MHARRGINVALRYAEHLWFGTRTGQKDVGKWVSSRSSSARRTVVLIEDRDPTVKWRDPRPVRSLPAIFDLGVGTVEGTYFNNVVSMNLRKVVLDGVQIFVVSIGGDVPDGLRRAIRRQATPATPADIGQRALIFGGGPHIGEGGLELRHNLLVVATQSGDDGVPAPAKMHVIDQRVGQLGPQSCHHAARRLGPV